MSKKGSQQGPQKDNKTFIKRLEQGRLPKCKLDEIVLATDLLLGIVQAGIIQPRVSSEKYLARVGEVLSSTQFRDTGWLLFLVFDVFVLRPDTLCEFYPLLPQSASFVVVHILLAPFFTCLRLCQSFYLNCHKVFSLF